MNSIHSEVTLSYAVTTHNEGSSIQRLIDRIKQYIRPTDELVILDDCSVDKQTLKILKNENVFNRKFKNNFADHKNYLNSLCKCDYIFQLDGDELPTHQLMKIVVKLVKYNNNIDLFWIPRENKLEELNFEYIKKWNWKVDNQDRINYPDYQGRIYRNSEKIYWTRELHEIIHGHESQKLLPGNSMVDILHHRHMTTQIKNNKYYDENFNTK